MPYTPRPGTAPIPNKPGKTNWVEQTGGLPSYIRRIAEHLKGQGKSTSVAIATAVNTVKRWAAGGTVTAHGGPRVNADTQAKAAAALAEWEAKKAASHSLSQFAYSLVIELSDSGGNPKEGGPAFPVDLAWNARLHPRGPDGRFIRSLGGGRHPISAPTTKSNTPDLTQYSYRDLLSLSKKRPELKETIRAEALRRNPKLAAGQAKPKPDPEVESSQYWEARSKYAYLVDEHLAGIAKDSEAEPHQRLAAKHVLSERKAHQAELEKEQKETRRKQLEGEGRHGARIIEGWPPVGSGKKSYNVEVRDLRDDLVKITGSRGVSRRIQEMSALFARRYGFGFDAVEPTSVAFPDDPKSVGAYMGWRANKKEFRLGVRGPDMDYAYGHDNMIDGTGDHTVVNGLEAMFVHEFGHALLGHPRGSLYDDRVARARGSARMKAVQMRGDRDLSTSRYSKKNQHEEEAELFAWYHWGGDERPEWVIAWGRELHRMLGLDDTPLREQYV